MTVTRRLVAATGVLLLTAGAAIAQDKYPSKPIRMVVPFPPGAASDFLARAIGQKLNELYGQQIIIDNRRGGRTGGQHHRGHGDPLTATRWRWSASRTWSTR